MKLLLWLVLLSTTILAEDRVAHFEGAPFGIAAGWVNVISGALVHSETDLIIPGIEPIVLSRSPLYSPGQSFFDRYKESWNFDFRERIQRKTEKEVVGFNGGHEITRPHDWLSLEKGYQEAFVFFNKETKHNTKLPYKVHEHAKGFTNQSGNGASAQTSIKNYVLEVDPHYNLALHSGSGEIRHYNSCMSGNRRFVNKICKPNGFYYMFKYEFDGQEQGVTLYAPSKREIAFYFMTDKENTLKISRTINEKEVRFAQCDFVREKGKGNYTCRLLNAVYRSDLPNIHYKYHERYNHSEERYLKQIIYPNDRVVQFNYWRFKEIDLHKKLVKDNPFAVNKVRDISVPSHPDGTMCTTHTFDYKLNKNGKGGWTTVKDCYDNKDIYRFNEDFRITEVEHLNALGQKEFVEVFKWDKDGQLLTSITKDGSGHQLRSNEYIYDNRGNILEEVLQGDLSGQSSEKKEREITKFTYSEDGKNLLKEEKHSNGLVIRYSYKPNTNVITEKKIFLSDLSAKNDKWVKKETFSYDIDHRLIGSIEDDGIRKTIIEITPLEYPFGFPEEKRIYGAIKEEKKQLLESFRYTYTDRGEKASEEKRDDKDNLVYKIYWVYDSHGKCIEEVNAVGDKIYRTYDLNDNCIQEVGPREGIVKEYCYDTMNRCTLETTFYNGAVVAEKKYGYDALGRCLLSTDEDGRKTSFTTDRFGRPTIIRLPNVEGREPTINQSFDTFGNIITYVDPLKRKTEKKYTAKNKVSYIKHPDQSEEYFYYTLDGLLKESIDQEGNHTYYRWDPLGRLLVKQTPFGQETYTYTGLLLTRSVDLSNVATEYRYDCFGRLIEKSVDTRKECLAYDVFGFVYKKSFYEDDKLLSTEITIRDALERVIESYIEDPSGTIFQHKWFVYDGAGNCIEEQEDEAITKKVYDGRNRVIQLTNPLDQTYTVNYRLVNGEREKTVTDPLGNKVITLYNTHDDESVIRHLDASGKELSKRCLFYDMAGELIKEEKTANSEVQTIIYERDKMGRVIVLREPLEKVTTNSYTPLGNLERKTKPDGIELLYTYEKGRLANLTSSDEKIAYYYTYNARGELIQVEDKVTGHLSNRTYSIHGDLEKENLPTGQTITYRYDGLGRLTSYSLPDGGKVILTYNAINATSVSRQDVSGNVLYTHAYTQFNPRGDVTEQKLIGNGGIISCSFDVMGQLTDLVHPHRKEENILYDDAGNLNSFTLNGTTHHFAYDSLYQLSKEDEHCYTFDAFRNRLSKDDITYKVNNLNELISNGSTKYTYDNNGNLKNSGTLQFDYDPLNRLVLIKQGEIETTFAYDSFNRRIFRNNIPYYYCNEQEIGDGHSLRILGIGLGSDIGATVALELDGTIYAPLHDHNGSITALLDLDGNLIESWQYTAFGEQLGSTRSPWTFASKRHEAITGHLSFGQRDYDPSTGRWTTPDPLGFEAGFNLYTYVFNQPLTKRDPLGLFAFPPLGMWNSALTEKNMTNLSNTLSFLENSHVQGAARALGGATEMTAGGSLALSTSPTGVGPLVGGLMIAHGADQFTSGINQFITGVPYTPLTVQGGQSLGLSRDTSYFMNDLITAVSTINASGFSWQSSRQTLPSTASRVGNISSKASPSELNRFHSAARNLSEVGQNNIRILRGWAKSKGWKKLPNPNGGPESWGIYDRSDKSFQWLLKLKPEVSLRQGLDGGSMIPRASVRLNGNEYINPFTGERVGKIVGGHIPLETKYY